MDTDRILPRRIDRGSLAAMAFAREVPEGRREDSGAPCWGTDRRIVTSMGRDDIVISMPPCWRGPGNLLHGQTHSVYSREAGSLCCQRQRLTGNIMPQVSGLGQGRGDGGVCRTVEIRIRADDGWQGFLETYS